MTTAELSGALEASTSTVLRVMNELVGDDLVNKDKMGSSNVYWASEYDLSPEEGVTEAVVVAKLQIPERRARTVAEEGLSGFFSKTEQIADTELEHLPLWQVDVDVQHSTGLIFKTTTEEQATLYLHAVDGRICTYHPSKGFAFSEVVDEDPLRIQDLDDACTFEGGTCRPLYGPDDALGDKVRHGRFLGFGGVMPFYSLEVLPDRQLAHIAAWLLDPAAGAAR